MRFTQKTIQIIDKLRPLFEKNIGVYFDFTYDTERLEIQAATQEELHKVTAMFPGVFWKKEYSAAIQWWSYEGICDGLKIYIYAIKEAPSTCKAIIETRKVKKQVPVAFEEREVEETVVTGWDCGGETEANNG